MQLDSVVQAHKDMFYTAQADIDASVMEAALATAASAPDFMTKMRLAAEYFRNNASFAHGGDLTDIERRQDVFVVASAFNQCDRREMSHNDRMKWIACCFRVQAEKAAAPI